MSNNQNQWEQISVQKSNQPGLSLDKVGHETAHFLGSNNGIETNVTTG